jgi:hypothetical protein
MSEISSIEKMSDIEYELYKAESLQEANLAEPYCATNKRKPLLESLNHLQASEKMLRNYRKDETGDTEMIKAAKATDRNMLRKMVKTDNSRYTTDLIIFSYGKEAARAIPTEVSFSMIDPEVRRKLDDLRNK